MRRLRKISMLAILPLITTGVFLGSQAPAWAGSNGQQVYFQGNDQSCTSILGNESIDNVIVSGQNQDGAQAVWEGTSSDGRTAWVAGWYWIGAVHVSYHVPSGWHGLYAYVPQSDQGDAANYQSGQDTVWVTCQGSIVHVTGQRIDMGPTKGADLACLNGRNNLAAKSDQIDVITGYDYSFFDANGTLQRTSSVHGPKSGPTVVTDSFSLFNCPNVF